MIRVQLGSRRKQFLRELLDTGEPSSRVLEVLAVPAVDTLVPIRHLRDLDAWLGRCHAYYGLGLPTTIVELRAKLGEWLLDIDGHPAMWGHGMLGLPRSVPISCWDIPGARRPERLYSLHPVGTEGFLVPTKERVGTGFVTAWTFEPCRHGPPRPTQTMFNPKFATAQEAPLDPAAQDATATQVRAEVLGHRDEADTDQGPLDEDRGGVPQAP